MPVVMIKSGFPRCGMLQLPPFKVQAEKKHLNHIGSVSYTHLDVYKRQIQT